MQIDRYRGDTEANKFVIRNEAGGAANLANCVVKMTLNRKSNPADNSSQVYQLIGVVNDPATGIVEFAPTAEQADLVGWFYFDIQLEDAQGVVRTLTKGLYQYMQDITK